MNKFYMVLCAGLLSWSVRAVDNVWRAVSGDYSGEYTNTAHWGQGYLPAEGENLYTANPANTSYTLTFPSGTLTNAANWILRSGNNTAVTLDGRGTTFYQPAITTNYSQWASGKFNNVINLERNSGGTQLTKAGLWFDDFLCVLSNNYHVVLKQGTFDFSRNGGRNTLFTSTVDARHSLRIESGATMIGASTFDYRSYCGHALVDVAGGILRAGTLTHPTGEGNNTSANASRYVSEFAVHDGGTAIFSSGWAIGNVYGKSTNRTFVLSIADSASSCTIGGSLAHTYGRFDLDMAGGTLTVKGRLYLANETSANGANGTNYVNLTGGTLVCNGLGSKSVGSGYFTANGGTMRSRENDTDFLSGFKTATLGSAGLTINAQHNLTVAQSFTNADGAQGKLIKTGSGTLTLSGSASSFAACEIQSGTLVVPAAASLHTVLKVTGGASAQLNGDVGLTGLTLGDASSMGRFTLTAGTTYVINGSVSFANARFVLVGNFVNGQTYTLLTATGDCTDAAAKWTSYVPNLSESGTADRAFSFTTETVDGVTSFKVTPSAAEIIEKNVTADETAAVDPNLGPYATYAVTVAEGAIYAVPTALTAGVLCKKGLGEMDVAANLLNVNLCVSIWDGTFAFTNTAMSTSSAVTVPVTVTNASGVVVVRTDSDVTLEDFSVTGGAAWIKHGRGMLTLVQDGVGTRRITGGNGKVAQEGSLGASIVRLEPGKAPPTSGYAGMSVAEGTLRFKGTGPKSVFTLQNSVSVGMVTPDVAADAQPTLMVDDCQVHTCASGYHFLLATDMRTANVDSYAGRDARIVVTNGGILNMDALTIGKCGDSGARGAPQVFVDGATLFSSYRIYFNQINTANFHPQFTIRNGGYLLEQYCLNYPNTRTTTGFHFGGSATVACDHATIAAASSATATNDLHGVNIYADGDTTQATLLFTNNATFWCARAATGLTLKRMDMVFDAATWEFGTGTNLCVEKTEAVHINVRSGGLTVNATTADPLQINQPFTGEGTLVKTGSATLWFDARAKWVNGVITPVADDTVTLACDVEVRKGTLAVSPGAASGTNVITLASGTYLDLLGKTVDNLMLAGEGTIQNGTLSGASFVVSPAGTDPVVTLGDNVSYSGAQYLDLGTGTMPYYGRYLVAKYAGTAPDVSGWKTRRHSGVPHLKATFTAVNGEICVEVCRVGTQVIVR